MIINVIVCLQRCSYSSYFFTMMHDSFHMITEMNVVDLLLYTMPKI